MRMPLTDGITTLGCVCFFNPVLIHAYLQHHSQPPASSSSTNGNLLVACIALAVLQLLATAAVISRTFCSTSASQQLHLLTKMPS